MAEAPINQVYRRASFLISAGKPGQFPTDDGAEVAFAGRSNAGKSSAINTLCGNKGLAKTSKTPGRTRLINFFALDDRRRLVDLPGYGYAKVPTAVRKKWGPMIETYLSGRKVLKGVVVIMDIRRTPREEEHHLIAWLEHYSIARILVLTKADKLSKTKQDKQRAAVAESMEVDLANPLKPKNCCLADKYR